MAKYAVVISALILSLFAAAQSQHAGSVHGIVSDAASGDPLPGANIRILGTARGTITNSAGEFFLPVDSLPGTVVVSYLAYESDTFRVSLPGVQQQNVRLIPSPIRIPEVVILAEDPAIEIIRQAIAHKHEWMDRLQAYRFTAFTRQVIMRDTGIAGISESYSDGYQITGDTLREVIRQRRQTNNVSSEENMASVRRIINFNEDEIRLFSVNVNQNSADFRFVGPTAVNALDNYDYKLLRTTRANGVDIYHIRMKPKSRLKPLFDGEIAIAGKTFAVVGLDVKPNEVFTLPFLKDIDLHYKQDFALYDSLYWMPADVRISGGFTVSVVGISLPHIGMTVTSSIYDYQINPVIPDSVYAKPRLAVDSSAMRYDSAYWAGNQILPLTKEESQAYATLDSTQTLEKQFEPKGPLAAMSGDKAEGVLDILAVRFNRVEGLFLGGGKEFKTLSSHLGIEVGGGYGISDRIFEYRFGGRFYSAPKHGLAIGGAVYRKLANIPDAGYYGPLAISLTSLFDRNDYRDYYMARGWEATGTWEPFRRAELTLGYTDEQEMSMSRQTDFSLTAGASGYRPNPSINDGNLHAISAGLRIGDKEVPFGFVSRKALEFTVERSSPSFTGGDFDFTRYDGLLAWYFPTFGREFLFPPTLRFQLTGGIGAGNLPAQRPFTLESRASGYAPFGVLRAADVREFSGDRYVMINIEHNFRSIPFLFLNIPFLYRNSIELVTHASFAQTWSGTQTTSGGWYSEAGIGISRIFDLLRADVTWRFHEPRGVVFSLSMASLF
jgi:hypothetical protein